MILKDQVELKKVSIEEKKLLNKAGMKLSRPKNIQDILNLLVPNREAMLKAVMAKKEKLATQEVEPVKSEEVEPVKVDAVESK